jgi:hypothetical protein
MMVSEAQGCRITGKLKICNIKTTIKQEIKRILTTEQ